MPTEALERLYRLTVDGQQANAQLNKISKSTSNIEKGFNGLRRAAASAFGAFAAFRGVQVFVEASDQINLLESSLEALTGSSERAAGQLQDVFDTVENTGANLKDVGSTFQRLTIGLQELGASNKQIDAVANTFIKLGRVSGTSMFETNAALVQFSQGLASGKLQGDELRSIMERLPLVTKLIQEEWNRVNSEVQITRGDVKQLGREGKLSAELITNALLNGAKLTAEQFENLVFTMEQQQNRLFANLKRAAAELSEVTGLDDKVKNSISFVNDLVKDFRVNISIFLQDMKAFDEASGLISGFAAVFATAITYSLLPSLAKLGLALKTFALSNPITAILTATVIAVPLIIANWTRIKNMFEFDIPEGFYRSLAAFYEFVGGLTEFSSTAESIFGTLEIKARISADVFRDAGIVARELQEEVKDLGTVAGTVGEAFVGPVITEGMIKARDELVKFKDQVLDTLDPMRAIYREMEKVKELVDRGWVTESQAQEYFDGLVAGIKGTTEEMSALQADLSQAGNAFIETFSTDFADALLSGELNFADFTKTILADLARMILRAVIFNSIMGALGGTSFGDFLGIPSAGGAGAIPGGFSVTPFANGDSGDSAVGVLQPPLYGRGTLSGSGGYGNITINNNAPVDVEVQQNQNNGSINLDILIEQKVNRAINTGAVDKSMRTSYGIGRRAF